MIINYRPSADDRQPKPMFVALSEFKVLAFGVRIRQLRLARNTQYPSPAKNGKIKNTRSA
jgi:hypothetical protein